MASGNLEAKVILTVRAAASLRNEYAPACPTAYEIAASAARQTSPVLAPA